jgi:hypothetical protein
MRPVLVNKPKGTDSTGGIKRIPPQFSEAVATFVSNCVFEENVSTMRPVLVNKPKGTDSTGGIKRIPPQFSEAVATFVSKEKSLFEIPPDDECVLFVLPRSLLLYVLALAGKLEVFLPFLAVSCFILLH